MRGGAYISYNYDNDEPQSLPPKTPNNDDIIVSTSYSKYNKPVNYRNRNASRTPDTRGERTFQLTEKK